MKYIAPLLLSTLLITALAACATKPISHEGARNVPADRIYQIDLLVSEGNRTIPVTITRDTGFLGMAGKYIFKIDGKRVAAFATGETLKIYLESAHYSFGVIGERSIFGISPIQETDVAVAEGGMRHFRIQIDLEGGARISPSFY